MTYDVRGVANFVLDLADAEGRDITNLSINKIVFFMHSLYLVEFRKSLVSAKIEAWNYGPVFRELYREFKVFENKPITGRAHRINPESGCREICALQLSDNERMILEKFAKRYISLSTGALIAMSHEKGGPWDQVWNHDKPVNASMSISDEAIKQWYEKAARH